MLSASPLIRRSLHATALVLALATLVSLRDAGDSLPAAAMLFSPWTDLAGTGDSLRTNHRRDAMFPNDGMDRAAAPYLAGTDPFHPLASPVYADLHGLPPLLLHAGSRWTPGPLCRMSGRCSACRKPTSPWRKPRRSSGRRCNRRRERWRSWHLPTNRAG